MAKSLKQLEVIRLRRYRDYLSDGKSWTENEPEGKNEVLVAVVVGVEPRTIKSACDYLDVDAVLLQAVEWLKKSLAAEKRKVKK